jgi:hypothetical protein
LHKAILDSISKLHWADALLGLFVVSVATTLQVGWKTFWNLRPLRRFFDDLGDNSKTLSVFAREMVSQDGRYYSWLPNGDPQVWQNFPVVGLIDVEAATDALNILGQAGRTANISWSRVTTDSGIWDEPMICVGRSFKVDQVLALCRPTFVSCTLTDTLVVNGGPTFQADVTTHDYGLVARLRHPETGVSCVVLVGFGMAGTAAAGNFLRRRAPHLARLYGARPFAVILRAGWNDGASAATPVWMSGDTMLAVALRHPIVWWRYRGLLRSRVV